MTYVTTKVNGRTSNGGGCYLQVLFVTIKIILLYRLLLISGIFLMQYTPHVEVNASGGVLALAPDAAL